MSDGNHVGDHFGGTKNSQGIRLDFSFFLFFLVFCADCVGGIVQHKMFVCMFFFKKKMCNGLCWGGIVQHKLFVCLICFKQKCFVGAELSSTTCFCVLQFFKKKRVQLHILGQNCPAQNVCMLDLFSKQMCAMASVGAEVSSTTCLYA